MDPSRTVCKSILGQGSAIVCPGRARGGTAAANPAHPVSSKRSISGHASLFTNKAGAKSKQVAKRSGHMGRLVMAAGQDLAERDLPDERRVMYKAPLAAHDKPEWNEAKFLRSEQLNTGVKKVVLEHETSQELVALLNQNYAVGRSAAVKVNGGNEEFLTTFTAPVDPDMDEQTWKVLKKLRGDIFAGDTKHVEEETSVKRELELYVREAENPAVYNMSETDTVEVGAFRGGGLKLRALRGIYLTTTILIFASGKGIAKAIQLARCKGQKGLNFKQRETVRMYHWEEKAADLMAAETFEGWEDDHHVKVTLGDFSSGQTFQSMFDDDDFEYYPESTGALVLCDTEFEEDMVVDMLVKHAEIPIDRIVRGSETEEEPTLLDSI